MRFYVRSYIRPAALVAGLLSSTWAATQARAERTEQCTYERDPVAVSGEIHRQRRASASGHDWNAPRGRKESAVLLKLRKPLCVMLPDDTNLTPRPHRIHEVELLSDDTLPRSSDKLHQVEGTLLLGETLGRRVPVLLEVRQIDEGRPRSARHR